jgi:hypothetical protein
MKRVFKLPVGVAYAGHRPILDGGAIRAIAAGYILEHDTK